MLSEQGRTRGGGSDTQGGRACVLKGSREPRVEGRQKTKGRLDALPLSPATSGYFSRCLLETFLLFKKPIITDHKGRRCRDSHCAAVCTQVLLEQEPAGLLPALPPTRAHSQPGHLCPPPGALGGSWCLQCSAGLWVPALGTGLRSHGWKLEVGGCGCGTAQTKQEGSQALPESAKALLFMFRLDHPLRILLKRGFHGWKRFEKSQLYLNSVSAKAK